MRVATWTADGPHRWSLSSAGRSRLLVDGEVAIDNWEPGPGGSTFYGMGSPEATGDTVLTAGQACDLVVEFACTPRLPLAGIRIGCQPPLPDDLFEQAVAAAASADAVIVVVGTTPEWESEGHDRASLHLPGRQDELIEAVAAVNPRCAVLLNTGSPHAAPWAERVAAVAQLWFGGQEVGAGAADVLLGATNPAGHLPTSFPMRLEDTAAFLDVPGDAGTIRYGEGLFMGYRWHDARDLPPRWCFGHGLSYTTFEHGPVTASPDGDGVEVTLDVTNTGALDGREVVQVYVGAVDGEAASVRRPVRELRAFTKVALASGEARTVTLRLAPESFQRWDAVSHGWTVDPGTYEIAVGRSSRDLRSRTTVAR